MGGDNNHYHNRFGVRSGSDVLFIIATLLAYHPMVMHDLFITFGLVYEPSMMNGLWPQVRRRRTTSIDEEDIKVSVAFDLAAMKSSSPPMSCLFGHRYNVWSSIDEDFITADIPYHQQLSRSNGDNAFLEY